MNEENFKLAEKYVSTGYVNQGKEARRVLEKNLRTLLEQVSFCFHCKNILYIGINLHYNLFIYYDINYS